MINYRKYPICDTDIWVNLCLGNIENELFKKHKKVCFVDVVRDEILKWKSGKYSFIADKFLKYIELGSAIIIEVNKLEELDKEIIEKQLIEDAGYPLGFNTPSENRKDMGEFMSAIVADCFGITLMKSEDRLFKPNGKGRILYPDIEIKCWRDTVIDLVDIKNREKILIKVKKENDNMNKEKERYNHGVATIDDILKLKHYFSKK